VDLHLNVVGKVDLADQIHRELCRAIHEGRLPKGEPLPPTRQLAQQLSVSRNTVTEAYERLMSEGLVVARVGAGTFVAHDATGGHGAAGDARAGAPPACIEPRSHWRDAGIPASWLAPSGLAYDFRIGAPDVTRFPFTQWRRLLAQETREFSAGSVFPIHPQGEPALRSAIARHVAMARGVRCEAADVLVTNGAQHAFELLGRVLVEPGTVVAVEEPCYPLARACFASFGAHMVGVPVDEEGLVVDRLPDDARLVYVTPSHQFPLGMPMSMARRRALLGWAEARRAVIVEDDYDSEFRFEDRPLESLQNLDRSGVVAYVGTFSKTMFAPLRRGFVVAPPLLRDAMVNALWVGSWQTPALGQAALARFIGDGLLARHVRKMRRIYDRRRRLILDILRRDFDHWLAPVHAAVGIHLSARLKQPLDLETLLADARAQGVVVYPLTRFCSAPTELQGLVLGFGMLDEQGIVHGLARLKALLDARR
jgi:GntR family transcriptional regulator / MocR family aminotransferase